MSNAKEAIAQSKVLVDLHSKRVEILEQLATLDETIAKVESHFHTNGKVKVNGKQKVAKPVAEKAPAEAPKRGRGRPKGSKNKKNKVAPAAAPAPAEQPEPAAAPEGKRYKNLDKNGKRTSLRELIVKICARHPSGIKLPELVKKCYDAGYRSTSDAKGFEQNIRTNLHTLMSKEIIVKDEEKRYHFQQQQQGEPQVAEVEAAV